jgi:hypothetical protein
LRGDSGCSGGEPDPAVSLLVVGWVLAIAIRFTRSLGPQEAPLLARPRHNPLGATLLVGPKGPSNDAPWLASRRQTGHSDALPARLRFSATKGLGSWTPRELVRGPESFGGFGSHPVSPASGHPAPDAVALVVLDGPIGTIDPNRTQRTDRYGADDSVRVERKPQIRVVAETHADCRHEAAFGSDR